MIRGSKLDKDLIRQMAALLDETGLTEIEFQDGKQRFRVAKGGSAPVVAAAPAPMPALAPAAPQPPAQLEKPAADTDWAGHRGAVTSPMVGTAYLSPEPGKPPFVREGDTVAEGQTVLIVEAMKTFNPIPAPRGGKVLKILAGDSQPVEFGQPLLVIE